jgi:hypothetical protein
VYSLWCRKRGNNSLLNLKCYYIRQPCPPRLSSSSRREKGRKNERKKKKKKRKKKGEGGREGIFRDSRSSSEIRKSDFLSFKLRKHPTM